MIKIVKKATAQDNSCDLTKVVATPLVQKQEKIKSPSCRIECGLNAYIYKDGYMRKES
jgi:hypothetical protein